MGLLVQNISIFPYVLKYAPIISVLSIDIGKSINIHCRDEYDSRILQHIDILFLLMLISVQQFKHRIHDLRYGSQFSRMVHTIQEN